ncbi:MAG: glycosyltransferase family 4 protein [Deltaproteobacteria bacterium]|nr:glycosyltransferase family 4 protein [Deltaproteobacteria bacterium]
MKVMHLCDHYRPIGGAEKLLFDTLDALEKAGVENVIATHDYIENKATGNRKEYIVHDLDMLPLSWNYLDYMIRSRKAKKALRRIIDVEKPDVIHIHNMQNPYTINEAVSSAPTVRSIHDPRLYCFNNWRILPKNKQICPYPLGYKCITEGCLWSDLLAYTIDGRCAMPRYALYLIHRKVDKLIIESEAMRACVLQNGYREEQIAFLPNFTRTFDFDEVISRLDQFDKPDENSILFVGRASFEKGIDYLLEAVAMLKIPFKLYLVTGGPAIADVHEKIKKLNLSDKVEVPGVQSYEKTRDYYAMADVVVVPSVWIESFCLVGIEAMANAKPVVAFRTGGIPDWLADGQTGYLAECRNVEDLADKIERVLRDKEEARALGIMGYRRVQEKYTMDVYLPRLLNIYESAIEAKRKA